MERQHRVRNEILMSDSNMMSKVAAHAPQHYAYLMKTAEEVRQSPFRDEIILQLDGIMKRAMPMGGMYDEAAQAAPGMADKAGKAARGAAQAAGAVDWKRGAKFVAGAAAAGIALNLGGDMYEAVKRGLTKGRHYKAMLEANPELRAKGNLPFVKRHFNTLHKFNPEYASDPHVAGSYIKSNVDLESDDIGAIHSLVKARAEIQKARQMPQAAAGLSSMMMMPKM